MKKPRQVDGYYPNTRGGETIPEDVLDYVDMYTQQNKFQYVDNIRIFRLGDREGEKQYQIDRRKGCCGSVDFVHYFDCDTEEDYLFGFNHGH